jgi:phage-related protein
MLDRELIRTGKRFSLYAIIENGKCPVKDFICRLTVENKNKILSLLDYTAQNGTPRNEEKFKKLETRDKIPIFELKAGPVRILCTFSGRSIIVLTHGFIKKQKKAPRSEIDRAFRLLRLYTERFNDEGT